MAPIALFPDLFLGRNAMRGIRIAIHIFAGVVIADIAHPRVVIGAVITPDPDTVRFGLVAAVIGAVIVFPVAPIDDLRAHGMRPVIADPLAPLIIGIAAIIGAAVAVGIAFVVDIAVRAVGLEILARGRG